MTRRLILMLLALLLATFAARPHIGYAQPDDPTKTPSSVIAPIVTATPRSDGSLVHVVGFGQSLTEIAKAYGVTVSEIQRLNGLPPDASTLYSGQKLLIVPRGGPNLLPTATQPQPPTLEPANTPTAELSAPTLVAPAAGSPNNGMILPLAGGLILLGGFLLLAAALVIQRKK